MMQQIGYPHLHRRLQRRKRIVVALDDDVAENASPMVLTTLFRGDFKKRLVVRIELLINRFRREPIHLVLELVVDVVVDLLLPLLVQRLLLFVLQGELLVKTSIYAGKDACGVEHALVHRLVQLVELLVALLSRVLD